MMNWSKDSQLHLSKIISIFTLLALATLGHFGFAFTDSDIFYLDPANTVMPDCPGCPIAGRLIDTSFSKPVTVLSDTYYENAVRRTLREAGVQIPEGSLLVANVFHSGKFYIAAVPRNAVELEEFLTEPFKVKYGSHIVPIKLAHAMLHFHLSKDILLVAETPDYFQARRGIYARPIEPIILHDLLVSPEPVGPLGTAAADPVAGVKNERVLVYRVTSLTGVGVKRIIMRKTIIKPTPLNSPDKSADLENAFRLSEQVGFKVMYNTVSDNCDKGCFRILEMTHKAVIKTGKRILDFWINSFRALTGQFVYAGKVYPPLAPWALDWLGWTEKTPQDVREFTDWEDFKKHSELYERHALACEVLLADPRQQR